jgi:mevalonate kinase
MVTVFFMRTPFIASAPGKLMLFGEHAVIYGHPCIVTALNVRLTVTVEESHERDIIIDAPGVSDTRFISAAVKRVKKRLKNILPGLTIRTKSEFSSQYGFGSSSAVTVATIYALCGFSNMKASLQDIFEMAYQTVLDVQGTGSGFDVAAAVAGGTLLYGNSGKIFNKIPINTIPLIVGYTGIKADTISLMSSVSKKRELFPEKMDRIFIAIEKIVQEAKERIIERDWERTGRLMNFNHEYLRDLGVSSEKLERLISSTKNAGAWGAKLSGAGDGDCMIAIAPESKKDAVKNAIQEAGGKVIDILSGAEGVRTEHREVVV